VAVETLSSALYELGLVAAITLSILYRPLSRVRTIIAFAAYASCIFTVLCWLVSTINAATLWFSQDAAVWSVLSVIGSVAPNILTCLCMILAVRETSGADRARLVWYSASVIAYNALQIAPYLLPSQWLGFSFGNLSLVVAPLGLTYALLNRKLLDIGFALNRAAIFGAVSTFVVGCFVMLEWGLGEWLHDTNRTTNIVLTAALALGIGLSIRAVHRRLEHVIDNVFFKKRHEDEIALRTFAHEAGFISNAKTVLERTCKVIEKHTDATSSQILLQGADGNYGSVSEDDPAIVSLRAWHKSISLAGNGTALVGDVAFPMSARGELLGVLVLGEKRSHEVYAPDETDAILSVAHNVGLALSAHESSRKDTRTLEEIRSMLALLLAQSPRPNATP
jgi:hypothetical protein